MNKQPVCFYKLHWQCSFFQCFLPVLEQDQEFCFFLHRTSSFVLSVFWSRLFCVAGVFPWNWSLPLFPWNLFKNFREEILLKISHNGLISFTFFPPRSCERSYKSTQTGIKLFLRILVSHDFLPLFVIYTLHGSHINRIKWFHEYIWSQKIECPYPWFIFIYIIYTVYYNGPCARFLCEIYAVDYTDAKREF